MRSAVSSKKDWKQRRILGRGGLPAWIFAFVSNGSSDWLRRAAILSNLLWTLAVRDSMEESTDIRDWQYRAQGAQGKCHWSLVTGHCQKEVFIHFHFDAQLTQTMNLNKKLIISFKHISALVISVLNYINDLLEKWIICLCPESSWLYVHQMQLNNWYNRLIKLLP